MRHVTHALIFSGLAFLAGCTTTSQVTRIDKEKRRFELQSQDDAKSAMKANDDALTQKLVDSLEKRIKDNPRDLNALINMSQAQLAMGRYNEAERFCRDALRVDLKNETSSRILAQIYYRRGNLEMAKVILNGIHATKSKDSQVLNLLGMIALRQNQPELALFNFQEALRNNPSDLAVRMNLGVLYVHYRQLGLAAVEFERILMAMPEHPDANLHLAIIESNRGNLARAEELYKTVLNRSKDNPVAIFNLAVLEDRRKNFDKAIDYLKRYLDTDFARRKNNQEVFALIDKVKNEQEALTGKRTSDDDIMKLAARKTPGRTDPKTTDQEFVEADPRHEQAPQGDNLLQAPSATTDDAEPEQLGDPPAESGKPATKGRNQKASDAQKQPGTESPKVEKKTEKKTKKYRNDEEEIQDLEKQLK